MMPTLEMGCTERLIMTLYQRVSELVGNWDGSDATDRMERREQMIAEVIAVVQQDTRRLYEARTAPRPVVRTPAAA
jgi:hypothetical protein